MADQTAIAAAADKPVSASERFTNMVMNIYGGNGSPYVFTDNEKQLIRNYFIIIDQTLAKAEAERVRKNSSNSNHTYDNNLPYTWNNVDVQSLAQDLAHYARVGLDMMEDNTLFPIPYKDSKGNQYTITLMEGYNGIRYQAEKYALDPFRSVTVEVVYETDQFTPIKKSRSNSIEGYEFNLTNPFDRGQPIGVFGYIEFDDPTKNKLVIMSASDVMKRKPKYASAEFWGGKKDTWVNGKKTTVELDGWLPEMFEKTMKRAIYGSKYIPRDPAKIDESYQYIRAREAQYVDIAVEAEVDANGNGSPIALPEPETEKPAVTSETISAPNTSAAADDESIPTPPEPPAAVQMTFDEVPF